MSGRLGRKRFWTRPRAEAGGRPFTVLLDAGRRTPRQGAADPADRRPWRRPSPPSGRRRQGVIDPATMPFTRIANSAIDTVAPQFAAVAEMLAAYGETDLLCYRADGPATLIWRGRPPPGTRCLTGRQRRWHAPLLTTAGVMHVAQPAASLARPGSAPSGPARRSSLPRSTTCEPLRVAGPCAGRRSAAGRRPGAGSPQPDRRRTGRSRVGRRTRKRRIAGPAAGRTVSSADRFYALCG